MKISVVTIMVDVTKYRSSSRSICHCGEPSHSEKLLHVTQSNLIVAEVNGDAVNTSIVNHHKHVVEAWLWIVTFITRLVFQLNV